MSYDMLVSCAWIMVCFCHIIFMNYTMLVLYVMSCVRIKVCLCCTGCMYNHFMVCMSHGIY